MNTQNNRPRINIERGLVNMYIPLPFGKAMNVYLLKGMYLKHMIQVQDRASALYDYADCGLKNYELLVALTQAGAK